MALLYSNPSELGSLAPDFSLPGTDGKTYSLLDFKGTKGLLIVFMCNHCPYVIAVQARLRKLAEDFAPKKISVIGINSNDPLYKDADSFLNMKKAALEWGLPFPYLFDEGQLITRQFGAKNTPHVFVVLKSAANLIVEYAGAIDNDTPDTNPAKIKYVEDAVNALLKNIRPAVAFTKAIGCGVKWKEPN